MQVITLTSDYGAHTYYVASLKGRLHALLPQATIVDITHNLPAYDLSQAAFLLQSCIKDFPEGTIHLIAVDTNLALYQHILVAKKEGHWIITADNGFLSMLNDEWDEIYQVNQSWYSQEDLSPEKNIFTRIAANLVNGVPLSEFATIGVPAIVVNNLKPVVEQMQIRASIVHVDGYDNAITNLSKDVFEQWIAASKFRIYYKRKEYLEQIEKNYAVVPPGSGVAVFNDMGWLEIALNRGEGKSLLGLKLGDQIIIEKRND